MENINVLHISFLAVADVNLYDGPKNETFNLNMYTIVRLNAVPNTGVISRMYHMYSIKNIRTPISRSLFTPYKHKLRWTSLFYWHDFTHQNYTGHERNIEYARRGIFMAVHNIW